MSPLDRGIDVLLLAGSGSCSGYDQEISLLRKVISQELGTILPFQSNLSGLSVRNGKVGRHFYGILIGGVHSRQVKVTLGTPTSRLKAKRRWAATFRWIFWCMMQRSDCLTAGTASKPSFWWKLCVFKKGFGFPLERCHCPP